jgi:Flp pilus assembly pilin Flp
MGMSLATFTLLHVLISLIGIVAGLVAMTRWLKSDWSKVPTAIFLATTILTSVTGFLFPFSKLLPSHIVGMISLVMLAVATFALYGRQLSGVWRPIYTVTATLSLYLNVFVLIVQSFLKIPILKAWAPTQTEPAFLIAQGSAFLVFLILAILITAKFRPLRLAAG